MTTVAKTQQFFLRVLVVALFIFALYSNIRLVFRNHQLSLRLEATKAGVAQREIRNRKLDLLIAYYQTDSYQDMEARRRLGVKKADEKVVAVKGVPVGDDNTIASASFYQDIQPSVAPPTESNLAQWGKYLFPQL